MSGMKVKLVRDTPGICPACKEKTVVEVYASECRPCRAIKFLTFRHVMNWPLDDLAKRNLGM